MKWKMLVLCYGVACTPMVKCRLTAPALGRGAPICGTKSSHPAWNTTPWGPARTCTNQTYINTKQHNRWAVRPCCKPRIQAPNIFIDFLKDYGLYSHDSDWVWSFVLVLSKTILWELFVYWHRGASLSQTMSQAVIYVEGLIGRLHSLTLGVLWSGTLEEATANCWQKPWAEEKKRERETERKSKWASERKNEWALAARLWTEALCLVFRKEWILGMFPKDKRRCWAKPINQTRSLF